MNNWYLSDDNDVIQVMLEMLFSRLAENFIKQFLGQLSFAAEEMQEVRHIDERITPIRQIQLG